MMALMSLKSGATLMKYKTIHHQCLDALVALSKIKQVQKGNRAEGERFYPKAFTESRFHHFLASVPKKKKKRLLIRK